MAALTAVGAWLRIPIPHIPVTLQMSFVYLSGVWLGSRGGALAQLVYVGAGLIGFPSLQRAADYTTFLSRALDISPDLYPQPMCRPHSPAQQRVCRIHRAAVASLAIVYLPGLVWLHVVLNYVLGQETTLGATLALGLSSLPKDLALIPINAYLGKQIKRRLPSLSSSRSERVP